MVGRAVVMIVLYSEPALAHALCLKLDSAYRVESSKEYGHLRIFNMCNYKTELQQLTQNADMIKAITPLLF